VEVRLEPEQVEEIRAIVEPALARLGEEGGWLAPGEVDACLRSAGLRIPVARVTGNEAEAVRTAAEMGGPVVLKVISERALHKSDVGGVILGVSGDDEVAAAFRKVNAAVEPNDGVLVQEYITGGHEVLIGMAMDPNFGPLVVYGLGGIYVELLEDVAFRIHPLTDVDASEMIRETKGFRLLEGYRDQPRGDVTELEAALLRVSGLVTAIPELTEMDLNPVKVMAPGAGVCVVDARMRLVPVPAARLPNMRDLPGVKTRVPI
jgi:acetyltransferase